MKRETQEGNVEDLISMLPKLKSAHDKIRLIFDRDYGKKPFVKANSKRNFDISKIATIIGSSNLFIPISESTTYIQIYRIKK